MSTVSTLSVILGLMTGSTAGRPSRKRRGRYHHGDLRRALLQEALRTIHTDGVTGRTLRGVGQKLGVSRTALYRHFADKSALLAAVGREGFRTFRTALQEAWESAGRGRDGFDAMGRAYVTFAVANPAHYRVMFGGFLEACANDPELVQEASAAFQVLVDALTELQHQRLVRTDDPAELARLIWALVHGIAMLAIDGQLHGRDPEALQRFAAERLQTGIGISLKPEA
jgi:AcrR family transcriptional regulator